MPNHPYDDDKRLLELLERWQTGDFTRADEQEMQALTGSDEFRREAAEGYYSAPEEDHFARLASIQERLRQQHGGGMRASYLRIVAAAAAMLLLILAVVWLLPDSSPTAPVAKNETTTPIEQPAPANPAPEPGISAESKSPAAAPGTAARLEQKIQDDLAKPADDKEVAINTVVSSEAQRAAPSASAPNLSTKQASNQGAAPEVEDSLEEEFGFDQASGNSAPSAKKSDPFAKAKPKKYPSKADSTTSAGPVTDWADLQYYLRRNARLTEAARQHNVSGSVQLRFLLGSDNQPGNFQILRSLGYGCDEEAIRLIKNYSWQSGDPRTLTVDVPFVR